MSLMILLFFSGAWYTMIREAEVASESRSSEKEVPIKEKVYRDGEAFTELDPDGKEVFNLQIKALDKLPEDAEVEKLQSNKKFAVFELYLENLKDHNVEFKGYYTNLMVDEKEIKPDDFVVIEEEGWNKFRLEAGGYLKLVLVYTIDKSTSEMKLVVSPGFYFKDYAYVFENK